MRSALRVFSAFLVLGCTSFGGPIAHLGYFRREFVERRGWLSDDDYADLVSMCQFLPGPSSSQTGFAIGLREAGLAGGIAAFLGFTLPSALLLAAAGAGIGGLELAGGWLLGLKALAVGVVIHALHGMARTLTATPPRAALAMLVAGTLVALSRGGAGSAITALAQPAVIALGALVGLRWMRGAELMQSADDAQARSRAFHVPRTLSALAFLLYLAVLSAVVLAPVLATAPVVLRAAAACAGAGALVFGGGHVVLPLLSGPFVEQGWLAEDGVLAGYSLAQAVPGPLFTMTSYLGAASAREAGTTAAFATAAALVLAVFTPGLLLVVAVLPTWHRLRSSAAARAALTGANAAVVGVLGAALADAVIPAGVRDLRSLAVAAGCTILLYAPRMPVVGVVLFGAIAGWLVLR